MNVLAPAMLSVPLPVMLPCEERLPVVAKLPTPLVVSVYDVMFVPFSNCAASTKNLSPEVLAFVYTSTTAVTAFAGAVPLVETRCHRLLRVTFEVVLVLRVDPPPSFHSIRA